MLIFTRKALYSYSVFAHGHAVEHPTFKEESQMGKLSVKSVVVPCCILLLFGVLAAVGTQPASAQETGRIMGHVKDKQTRDPLPQANVVVNVLDREMAPRGVATNNAGEFEIKGLPAGRYRITISFVGYGTYVREIELAAGQTEMLDVALKPGININPIVVSASRRPEKVLEAPASISVVDARQIAAQPSLSPAEHAVGLPGVDIATSGLAQRVLVVRGFSNIFSGSLLMLTDNRIAHVPSLRVNIFNFNTSTNEDVERVEVVSGPASALYGPNAANGVFHTITKSPFGSEGTILGLGGGERNVVMGSGRHAGTLSDKFGYKISMHYYEGKDWRDYQQEDVGSNKVRFGRQTATGKIFVGDTVTNKPNFNVRKLAGEARLDYLVSDEMKVTINAGLSRASQIELTGIGAGQAIDWTYTHFQTRFTFKDLFVQFFVNASDAGDTYIMRTGDYIIDRSKLIVGQVQHSYAMGDRQRFTYGIDVLLTRPDTDGTINGLNEDKDNIDQYGGYLQSETQLTNQFTLVAAARVDHHTHLEDPVFSPRAALVYKPSENHNFRATYNKAFSTPSTNNLFLDILVKGDVFGIGVPAFSTNVRAQGVPKTGFTFRRSADGAPEFRSPFAPLRNLTAKDYIPLHDPLITSVVWGIGRQIVLGGFLPTFQGFLAQRGDSPSQIAARTQELLALVPQQVAGVRHVMKTLNSESQSFDPPVDNVVDIGAMKPEITQTFEIGYKGLITGKLLLGVDVYRTTIKDFVGPLIIETPNVFLDENTLKSSLSGEFTTRYNTASDSLKQILQSMFGANPVPGLTGAFSQASGIPFGTVSPFEAYDPTAIILTYRNFGDISHWGADFHATYFLDQNWTFSGSYSYVNKDWFPKNNSQPHDIALNAPRNKYAITTQYRTDDDVINATVRFRSVSRFPVNTGVYRGTVEAYTLVDVNVSYELPFVKGTRLTLVGQNVLDSRHREMIGGPSISRLVLVKATYTL